MSDTRDRHRATLPAIGFTDLKPSETAKKLHGVISTVLGKPLATAVVRDACKRAGVTLETIGLAELPATVEVILEATRPLPKSDKLETRLKELLLG